MQRLKFARLLFGAVVALLIAPFHAPAESGEDQIGRLQKELSEVRTEVERLRKENAALRAQAPGTGRLEKQSPPPAAASTRAPVSVNIDEVLRVQDVIGQYRVDPMGAENRFKGRRLRIKGFVEKFELPSIGLTYVVFLRGSEPIGLVRCATKSPGITALSVTPDQKTLLGEPFFKRKVGLATLGQEIVIEGTCLGLREGTVHFAKCRPFAEK